MNSNLSKALALSIVGLGVGANLHAQVLPAVEYDSWCYFTTSNPYSTDFEIQYSDPTPFFEFGMGISGTVKYLASRVNCIPDVTDQSVPVAGRIGFSVGVDGSSQDDLQGLAFRDDSIRLSHGTNSAGFGAFSGSGWSFFRIITKDAKGAIGSELFGKAGISLTFWGASNRYFVCESKLANGVRARVTADALGDTARLHWTLTNESSAPMGIGLWYGTMAQLTEGSLPDTPYGPEPVWLGYTDVKGYYHPYITAGSNRPIIADHRFTRATDPGGFPSTINILTDQQNAVGLQLVNGPTPETSDDSGNSDATPVDEVVVGKCGFLISNSGSGWSGGVGDPPMADVTMADTVIGETPAVLQKWEPNVTVPVSTGVNDPYGKRDIYAYYRTPWGDSSYYGGYTVVCDTPKTINLMTSDNTQLTPNPYTIRVTIDNTGGFGIVDHTIKMQNVRLTLNLPQGMHEPGTSNRQIIKYIDSIDPVPMIKRGTFDTSQWKKAQVDFQVEVDPTLFGPAPYQLTVEPSPNPIAPNLGVKKTVKGVINVASVPKLLIRNEANLVGVPWVFSSNSWQDVLNPSSIDQSDPAYMHVDQDYQVFAWDPAQQAYVIQTSPVRGGGSWIISSVDRGYRDLGGTPTQPTDMFDGPSQEGGADQLTLKPGWNLISNPYNFSFPVRQINGVPQGSSTVYSWDDLVTNGLIDGALTYYDQSIHNYSTLQPSDISSTFGGLRMSPNVGYWLYVSAAQNVTLRYPPVYDVWIRSAIATAPHHHTAKDWYLQLAAQTGTSYDAATYIGVKLDSAAAKNESFRKAPLAPAKDAMRAYATDLSGTATAKSARAAASVEWAKSLRSSYGQQSWLYNVTTRKAGQVVVTWPNLSQLPRNLRIQATDLATGRKSDLRQVRNLVFNGGENSTKTYRIDVAPMASTATQIGYASATSTGTGYKRVVHINYTVTQNARTNIRIIKNGVEVYKALIDQDDVAGSHTAIWKALLPMGAQAPAGRYTIEIAAEGEGGDVATRQVLVNLGN